MRVLIVVSLFNHFPASAFLLCSAGPEKIKPLLRPTHRKFYIDLSSRTSSYHSFFLRWTVQVKLSVVSLYFFSICRFRVFLWLMLVAALCSFSFRRSSRGASGFDEVRITLRETTNRKTYIGKLWAELSTAKYFYRLVFFVLTGRISRNLSDVVWFTSDDSCSTVKLSRNSFGHQWDPISSESSFRLSRHLEMNDFF